MKWLALIVSITALALATSAQAARPHHHSARWYHLSLQQKRTLVVKTIHRERSPLRWWLRTRQRIPASASGPLIYCASVGARMPNVICVHAGRLVNAVHVLRRIDSRLAAIARAEAAQRLAAAYPPHHALWTCIGRYEGSATSINPNGHYGLLQMHAGWGYGTSYHASDDPQSVQEWAAERAYAAAGYASSFLWGQWFSYDNAEGECLRFA